MDNSLVLETARHELESDEVIQWTGQPDPVQFSLYGIPILVFGIIWTSFSVNGIVAWSGYRTQTAGLSGFDSVFTVLPDSFVLIGIGLLSFPVFCYLKALGTVYAMTNRRLLIIHINFDRSRTVQSFRSVDLNDLELKEKPNGSGSLMFARQSQYGNEAASGARVGFVGIQDVREVQRLLVETVGRK